MPFLDRMACPIRNAPKDETAFRTYAGRHRPRSAELAALPRSRKFRLDEHAVPRTAQPPPVTRSPSLGNRDAPCAGRLPWPGRATSAAPRTHTPDTGRRALSKAQRRLEWGVPTHAELDDLGYCRITTGLSL